MPMIKLVEDSPLTDKEPERVRAVADLLAERDWYAYVANLQGEVEEPTVEDFSNFSICMGRKVSLAECDLFVEEWNACIEMLKNAG